MARKPDGKSAKVERVTFTRPAAERIAKVVREVEAGDRGQAGLTFGSRVGGAGGGGFKYGTISQTWFKGASMTVVERNGDDTAKEGSPTFVARNHFSTVNVSSGTKRVACARVGGTWILIAAEC